MEHSPEQEASAKLAQSLAVAVQVLESALRMQQQNAEKRAAATQQQAAAIRAEQAAQHTAARLVWSRTADPAWLQQASAPDLARAWGAAASWADVDPAAETAATKVERRFSEQAPESMARYDELRNSGFSRADSFTAVARDLVSEIEATANPAQQPRVWVAEPATARDDTRADIVVSPRGRVTVDAASDNPDDGPVRYPGTQLRPQGALNEQTARDAAAETGGETPAAAPATERQLSYLQSLMERYPDRIGDRETDPAQLAALTRPQASAYIAALGGAPTTRRVNGDGTPHPADIAAESFPHKVTTVKPAGPSSQPSPAPAAAAAAKTRSMSR